MRKLLLIFVVTFPVLVLGQNELTDELRYSREQKSVYQGTRKMDMDDLYVRMRPILNRFNC